MNRQYEGIIFMNPTLSQEEINSIIAKIKNILADLKGNFIEEKQYEKMKLPFTMKKFNDGFYYYIKMEMSTDVVANFRDRVKLIDGIIRIMISLIVNKIPKIKDKEKELKQAEVAQEISEEKEEVMFETTGMGGMDEEVAK